MNRLEDVFQQFAVTAYWSIMYPRQHFENKYGNDMQNILTN